MPFSVTVSPSLMILPDGVLQFCPDGDGDGVNINNNSSNNNEEEEEDVSVNDQNSVLRVLAVRRS